jgi:hypothetical protein
VYVATTPIYHRSVVRYLALVVVLAGCAEDPVCHAPAVTTYDCAPVGDGTAGCTGGPVWVDRAGQRRAESLGTVFPVGCHADIPECSPYYMGSPRTFICQGPDWVEPL